MKKNTVGVKSSGESFPAPILALADRLERDLDAARQDIADLDQTSRELRAENARLATELARARIRLTAALAREAVAEVRANLAESDVRRMRQDAKAGPAKVRSTRFDDQGNAYGCEHGICQTGCAACVGCQFRRSK